MSCLGGVMAEAAVAEQSLVLRMARGASPGSLMLGYHPGSHSFGIGWGGQGCSLSPSPCLLPHRQLESWQERAQVRQRPHKGPEEQEDETEPKTSPSPLNLAPGTESPHTPCQDGALISDQPRFTWL